MDQNSNPIEFLIDFAWASGADRFVVNNAKDELRKLQLQENNFEELKQKYNQLLKIFDYPVAYGKINNRQDLYDLRLCNNPHEDQNKLVPLYSNREEFLTGKWRGYFDYGQR
jgi:hypothetical protein